MKHLVIGMGEVGTAIAEVLAERAQDLVETYDLEQTPPILHAHVLHICFPYTERFLEYVNAYKDEFHPDLIIIYSSTAIGTTKRIEDAVHVPVEGQHPNLVESLKHFKKFIGYNDVKDWDYANSIWRNICIAGCEAIRDSDFTEFLKLASTSKYGINIVWADYMAKAAERLGMDYQRVRNWDYAYNDLYIALGLTHFRKFVLTPPNGEIGGHCVVPNAELLAEEFPDTMLGLITGLGNPE